MKKRSIILTEINTENQAVNKIIDVDLIAVIEENISGRINCFIYFTDKDLLRYQDSYNEIKKKLSDLTHWELKKPHFIDLHKLDGPAGQYHDHREYVNIEQIKSIENSNKFGGKSLITFKGRYTNSFPYTESPEEIRELARHCSSTKV